MMMATQKQAPVVYTQSIPNASSIETHQNLEVIKPYNYNLLDHQSQIQRLLHFATDVLKEDCPSPNLTSLGRLSNYSKK
jgi:hypothetical protein